MASELPDGWCRPFPTTEPNWAVRGNDPSCMSVTVDADEIHVEWVDYSDDHSTIRTRWVTLPTALVLGLLDGPGEPEPEQETPAEDDDPYCEDQRCEVCDGHGFVGPRLVTPCADCDGLGWITPTEDEVCDG